MTIEEAIKTRHRVRDYKLSAKPLRMTDRVSTRLAKLGRTTSGNGYACAPFPPKIFGILESKRYLCGANSHYYEKDTFIMFPVQHVHDMQC